MAVVRPDVIVISSDEDSDGDGNFVTDVVLISSDDEEFDGERNFVEGFVSEQDAEYNELEGHKLDKEEECIDNCNDGSGPSNQGGSDLHALSHNECKTYLLKHAMRVSGTKEECIQRIEEHERLKDGGGESLYPRSSFSINCTGDACRGDVVLFKQNLYNNQHKIIGRGTVAGRIANESYGATTQHHTFSVEVLWSKPFKQFDPLNVLLVKGCNLYRFGTFRQPWENEAERLKVLEEKHERGKAARRKRKLRETEFASGGNKGTKRRKLFHRVPSQRKHSSGLHKHTHVNKNITTYSQAVLFQTEELKGSTQLTCHPDPKCSMPSEHHIQEASLPFTNDRTLLSFGSGCSHHSNEQGPSQTSQLPDHHDHDSKLPVDRSKDEKAKLHFPISSFSVNCTGDAHKRDIVLFKQQVYLGGNNTEKERTVAGRIVKVRQCGNKHRFLIKVLWTIPFIENLQRSTLLVRSHNLYKFGTFRQPWRNETMRSQMFEEKHKPASFKRKLKKTDIALNKNKGVKRQKASHNGSSSSKQPTQAKHKFSKKKGTSVTPHKKVPKIKIKNSKQTFQLDPNSNPDMKLTPSLSVNPNVNPNPDLISSAFSNLNLISSTTSNLNPISSTPLNPISSTTFNPSPASSSIPNPVSSIASKLNPISCTTSNLNPISSATSNPIPSPHPNLNPNAHPNPNLKACQNRKPKARQSWNRNAPQNGSLNARQNRQPNAGQNGKPNARLDQNALRNGKTNTGQSRNLSALQNRKPKAHQIRDPNAFQSQNPNTHQNQNPRQNRNPSARQNRNLNACHNQDLSKSQNPYPNPCQNPNSLVYGGQRLHESSLSLSYDRSFMPNLQPFWFPPNQPPFPQGYGGQWGSNHVFIQPPDYNYVAAQLLISLWYPQPL